MEKIKTFLSSVPKWQLFVIPGFLILLITSIIFVAPLIRRQAVINLGSDSGLIVTADKQDSLGVFDDSHFTLKADQDLTVKAIKDNLKTDPETQVEIVEVSSRQYQIIPKDKLNPNEVLKIKLSTGEREYSWAFQTRNNFRIVRTLPADRATSVPVNSGVEITFSHDNFQNVDNYFSITPKVEGRFEIHQRTVSFIPKKLEPGTLYTVAVKKGVKLDGSTETLSEDTTFRFETESTVGYNYNRLNLARLSYEFSTKEVPAMDLYAGSIDSLSEINVKVFKYSSLASFTSDYQNKMSIPRWASSTYDSFVFSSNNLTKTLEFTAPVQKYNYSGYFIFPQILAKGYYLVEVENNGQKSQALIQITDLSAYFTVSGSQTLAWVNRVDTSSPAPAAKVAVMGQDYTADKDGVAMFTSPSELVSDANRLITIKDSQDTLVIPAADRNYYYPYGDYEAVRRVTDKYWSYLYLDRPVYLPNDTVRFWGLLRDRDDINKSQKITVSLTRSEYLDYNFEQVSIYEKEYDTSSIGTFIGDIPVKSLNPGWYSLNIKIAGKNVLSSGFSVETYSKPAYQISLDTPKKTVIAGENIDFNGQAAFFEGTPVPNLKLKISGETQSDITTNSQGKFQASFATKSNPEGEYYQPVYKYFSVNPLQSEEGDITAGSSVAVFNASIHLRTKVTNQKDTARVSLDLNQVDTSKFEPYQYGEDQSFIGSPVTNHEIAGELFENTWQKKEIGTYYDFISKTTSPRYEYTPVSTSLGSISLTTDGQGKAVYEFPTQKDKYYQIKLRSVDQENRTTSTNVYIYGSNYQFSGSDNRLTLVEEKTEKPGIYLIDEPVSLTPNLNGKPVAAGKMLYLFAQRGIKGFSIQDTNKFTFNFKENFVPDVQVQAVRFTGSTYQLSESTQIRFDTSVKKTTLDLKLDKLFYKPGDKARLLVSVKDAKGNPVASEVNINLVDEAIFQMFPTSTDPLSQVYKMVGPDIVSFYLSHQYPVESNMAEGGGCFLSGTKILLANNTTKNIENIVIGDKVKTRTGVNDGKLVDAKVLDVQKHEVGSYLLINRQLRVTPEHNLFINGRWMTAAEIKIGDSYLDTNGSFKTITNIETHFGKFTVYNLSVDIYHTFFANGFFVHNEKGRDLFVDTAFFGSIQTGSNGEGSVDITLPDNLTSWRITSQAISQDLKVGIKTEKLVVKLPFFVDLVMGKDYLTTDKPVLTLRGFGDQLGSQEKVNFHVSISTLGVEKDLTANAYEAVGLPLSGLTPGIHQVTVTGTSGSLKDKVIRPFGVVDTRLRYQKADYQNLTLDTKLTGNPEGNTELVFSDQNSGRFYSSLQNMLYSSGDRLDQKLTRVIASELLRQYFDGGIEVEPFNSSVYAQTDGGYSILPYSSSDLTLSVQAACLAPSKIDKAALVNYFYTSFTTAKEINTASQSLAGLGCLNQPVLLLIDKLYLEKDIDGESKAYLSLAQAMLGDKEKSSAVVNSLLKDYSTDQDNLTFVKLGKSKDDYLHYTSLLAAVAAINEQSVAEKLENYSMQNSTKDILIGVNRLLFINKKISQNAPESSSFSYTIDGKKVSKTLGKGEATKIIVNKDQLINIKFEDIKGNVGVTSVYTDISSAVETDKNLNLNRNYAVSGKNTTEFITSDLVRITLNYSIKDISQDGCYQVNDYLPSGLKVVTSLFSRTLESKDISYPYSVDGQKVSFCVYKDSLKPIRYYARVVSPGQFRAENAIIQSMVSPSIFNLSDQTSVTIK